jgi:hypothetical protein
MALRDIPPFEITNRVRHIAAVRVRTQPYFREAYQRTATILCNEFDKGHRSEAFAVKNRS